MLFFPPLSDGNEKPLLRIYQRMLVRSKPRLKEPGWCDEYYTLYGMLSVRLPFQRRNTFFVQQTASDRVKAFRGGGEQTLLKL